MLNQFDFYKKRMLIQSILLILFAFNCTPATYTNACEFGSKTFVNNFIITTVGFKKDSYCGIVNSDTAAANAAAANGLSFTAFSVLGSVNALSKDYAGTINGSSITLDVPYGKAKTLIPSITSNAISIFINGYPFVSGNTPIDFSTSFKLLLVSPTAAQITYTVTPYLITPVADTGQTICFNNGSVAACSATAASFPNQDGELQNFPNPKGTQAISTNAGYPNDPINVDTLKGLIWKTCHEGLSGAGCATGTASVAPQSGAATMCNALNSANAGNGYAGLKKWRLPNIQELIQLIEYNGNTNHYTYWNLTYFPNSPTSVGSYRWTSSIIGGSALSVFDYVQSQPVSNSLNVHCVNGDPQPSFDMVNNGDGTITDNRTKLIWQRCAYGQANDATCSGSLGLSNWSSSMLFCKNLTLGGKSWRMPNVNEIMTMVDVSRSSPFVDPALFPNIAGGNYDTTTSYQANLAYSQILTINTPNTQGISGKGGPTYNLRCVAGP